ncbi:uncharacterized protein LOC107773576 [Nicotiana tabacum]|uniref:Uncharacterized protein LOC107773576 n=2 Tax=Nicotiana tabacum TaxID=4097 RepID=A0AC58SLZ7_TOBAC
MLVFFGRLMMMTLRTSTIQTHPAIKLRVLYRRSYTIFQDMDCKGDNRPVTPPLHLAAGFGIGSGNIGDGNADYYYRSMIQENPNSALLLRNYAQFLDQCKGDLKGAEEYNSRAILAYANDGEIISQYAKLIWKLHHDQDKALGRFISRSSDKSHRFFFSQKQVTTSDNILVSIQESIKWADTQVNWRRSSLKKVAERVEDS